MGGGYIGHFLSVGCTGLHCTINFRLVHCKEFRLEVIYSDTLRGSIQVTPTITPPKNLKKLLGWFYLPLLNILEAEGCWLTRLYQIMRNMVRLIAKEIIPTLGLASNICRPKMGLRYRSP